MQLFYKKSTQDFYIFLFLIILSVSTIILDNKYKKINYIRSIISDVIIYPIDVISSTPKSIIELFVLESQEGPDLQLKITKLQDENLNLKIKLQELQSLKDENLRLRNIAKESTIIANKQTLVKVISASAHPNKKIISIDKGRKESVFEGQNVLGLKGLIGQVIEVNYLSSKVLLISDLNHNVPAQITRTGEKLIVSGMGSDDRLRVSYAPLNMDIKIGDVVATSGIADRFKLNIPIGKISDVIYNQDKNFVEAIVLPYENIGNIAELILIWDYIPKKADE
ncbi:MAG: rod shape-determining protein MreC [Pelagibacterales bacterium]|nr:rod shape-determining protein MreC [Pelagibacterales bacterium]